MPLMPGSKDEFIQRVFKNQDPANGLGHFYKLAAKLGLPTSTGKRWYLYNKMSKREAEDLSDVWQTIADQIGATKEEVKSRFYLNIYSGGYKMSKSGREMEALIKDMIRQELERPTPELTQALFDHSGLRARMGALDSAMADLTTKVESKSPDYHMSRHYRLEEEINALQKQVKKLFAILDGNKVFARETLSEFFKEWTASKGQQPNGGDYWTMDEDKALIDLVSSLIGPIGNCHGRSAGAIQSRLRLLIEKGVNPFRGSHNNLSYLRKIRYYGGEEE